MADRKCNVGFSDWMFDEQWSNNHKPITQEEIQKIQEMINTSPDPRKQNGREFAERLHMLFADKKVQEKLK